MNHFVTVFNDSPTNIANLQSPGTSLLLCIYLYTKKFSTFENPKLVFDETEGYWFLIEPTSKNGCFVCTSIVWCGFSLEPVT